MREQLGSEAEQRYVRELRIAHDAVMVGAGTVRVDDPMLTVRPPHDRVRPYRSHRRVRDAMPCGAGEPSVRRRPKATRKRSCSRRGRCDSRFGCPGGRRPTFSWSATASARTLDLAKAMEALRARDICSVLCEGGPKLAAGADRRRSRGSLLLGRRAALRAHGTRRSGASRRRPRVERGPRAFRRRGTRRRRRRAFGHVRRCLAA